MDRIIFQYSFKKVVSPESELTWAAAGWAERADEGDDSAGDIMTPSRISMVPTAQITSSAKVQPYLRERQQDFK